MPFLISLLVFALMVAALIDVIRRDEGDVRYLPRLVWILLIVILPFVGSAIWFGIGREYPQRAARPRPRPAQTYTNSPMPPAPSQPSDMRTTEQQIADLDREIEEWRLRTELARRQREQNDDKKGDQAEA